MGCVDLMLGVKAGAMLAVGASTVLQRAWDSLTLMLGVCAPPGPSDHVGCLGMMLGVMLDVRLGV